MFAINADINEKTPKILAKFRNVIFDNWRPEREKEMMLAKMIGIVQVCFFAD